MTKVLILPCILIFASLATAQGNMPGMAAMENSVGFIASGTSIEPKVTSEFVPMVHKSFGNWTFVFHANAFLVNTQQSGPRGHDKTFSPNWLMPMVSRDFGRQTLTFRTMLSLEPATITQRRYPELFQTRENAFGFPIVDCQHPHHFFFEIGGRFEFRPLDQHRQN